MSYAKKCPSCERPLSVNGICELHGPADNPDPNWWKPVTIAGLTKPIRCPTCGTHIVLGAHLTHDPGDITPD